MSRTGDAMKLMGPKDAAGRAFCAFACIWGIAIAARLAMNALGRIWPLVVIAGVVALVWLVLGRWR